jgi:predicted aconitase
MVEFGEKELKETEGLLSKVTEVGIDLVIFGCPHTSITEFKELAQLLSEKKIKSTVELWVSTSRMVKTYAEVMGYANIIESSGAKILCNACPIAVARRRFTNDLGPRAIATNSAKLTYYITQGHEFMPYYGSTERCIQAATCGKWR